MPPCKTPVKSTPNAETKKKALSVSKRRRCHAGSTPPSSPPAKDSEAPIARSPPASPVALHRAELVRTPVVVVDTSAISSNMALAPRPGDVYKALRHLQQVEKNIEHNGGEPFSEPTEDDFKDPHSFCVRITNATDSFVVENVMEMVRNMEKEPAILYGECLRGQASALQFTGEDNLYSSVHTLLVENNYRGTDEEICLLAMGLMLVRATGRPNSFELPYYFALETGSSASDDDDSEQSGDEDMDKAAGAETGEEDEAVSVADRAKADKE